MAFLKSTVGSAQYITPINNPAVTVSQYTTGSARPVVYNSSLIEPLQNTNPGVFTAGTAREGTLSNPNNDGNQ
jgi:hypothetical protein